ncbi:MAG: tetratricopeptide repeat protein [Cyanobium sp.]
MPASRHNRQLRWLLALPMAWALALPIEARERSPSLASPTGTPLLAQASLPTDAEIPKEITALEQTARGFYERGDYQKALELMQRVMVWVNANLSKNAPYRASSQSWMGLLLSAVGRRQEALAPTEEALKIYRELAKTNSAYLPDLAFALIRQNLSYWNLSRRQEALASVEEAVKIYREVAKTNTFYMPILGVSLTMLGYIQLQLGQPEIAREAYEEALAIYRPLAASEPIIKDALRLTQNSLDELNLKEGIRAGVKQVLSASDLSYLSQGDSLNAVKRSVVRLVSTFYNGKTDYATGFVVRRQGDRAWIATALHVVRDLESNALATKVEAELFTGPLPAGVVAPRMEVLLSQEQALPTSGDEPIVLEVRGLPPDIQPLPLATTPVQGVLMVVGHPSKSGPWTVVSYPLLKTTEQALLLDGGLDPGASGSPVLSASRQVVGVVYDSPEVSKSRPIPQVWAFPVTVLKGKMTP